MTCSRRKAIRITIVTAAVSLLLSAVCAGEFILSMTGMLGTGNAQAGAYAQENDGTTIVMCVGEEQEDSFTRSY